ncbi:MAG: hypothetical protein ABSA52_24935 [Candidatus Binatia bacterium]|jgi:hypothetical protein
MSQEIGAAGALGSAWDALVVHSPAGCFVHCSAMVFLGTWGRQQVLAGRRILLRGDEDALRYLARINLHEHLVFGTSPATFTLTDQQLGDGSGVVGTIVDPSGPALSPKGVAPVMSFGGLVALAALLGVVAWFGLRNRGWGIEPST